MFFIVHALSLPDKYNDFIDANRIEDAEDRLKTMKKLVSVRKMAECRVVKKEKRKVCTP